MATIENDLLPTAKDLMKKIALAESEKAAQHMRERSAADAEKKALVEQMRKPSGLSDQEGIRRGAAIIQRAVNAGLTEVEVYLFPNSLCTDHGRAINQQEPGWEEWEDTLTGVPKEIYQLWHKHFRSKGYKLRVQIVDWPGGMPGDIGMTLSWHVDTN